MLLFRRLKKDADDVVFLEELNHTLVTNRQEWPEKVECKEVWARFVLLAVFDVICLPLLPLPHHVSRARVTYLSPASRSLPRAPTPQVNQLLEKKRKAAAAHARRVEALQKEVWCSMLRPLVVCSWGPPQLTYHTIAHALCTCTMASRCTA